MVVGIGPPRRQQGAHHHSQGRDRRGGGEEHGAPAERAGDQAGDRPRQHDAGEQAAHHIADHPATARIGREMGGDRHQHLRRHREQADQQTSEKEKRTGGRDRRQYKRQRRAAERRDDEPAILDEVAERNQQSEAGAIAALVEGHDQARGLIVETDRRRDQTDQRLGVIDVRGEQAAGRRQKKGHPAWRALLLMEGAGLFESQIAHVIQSSSQKAGDEAARLHGCDIFLEERRLDFAQNERNIGRGTVAAIAPSA